MFRCYICNEKVTTDMYTVGIQCENCGGRVFYKERPNVKKELKAR
ncbi:MAG: DNA-directed RNA polymerase subunit P [Candidatus Thermoplasmatota archaeon]|nr:DNA-directed RNA polymerase subunit P [Candidatus Thermoplasmatota archaeon]MBS3790143.1 DNA-directed RNA polymerase subunit P [Candidatus Thermoplasmatota archaeon]